MRLRTPSGAALLYVVSAALVFGSSVLLANVFASTWPELAVAVPVAFVPLYTRIGKPEVLDHETRGQLYGMIRAEPGIHAHELSRRLGIGWGTAIYHLRLLEEKQLVVCERAGRYKRFFLNSGEFTGKKEALCCLRNPTTARVHAFVLANPGAPQKTVSATLTLSPSLVSWHTARLVEARLVERRREGRTVRYLPGALTLDPVARATVIEGAPAPTPGVAA